MRAGTVAGANGKNPLIPAVVHLGRSKMSQQSPDPFIPRLALAKGADPSLRGPLLEAYRSYLTLLARIQVGRRLQAKCDASDLVQETFLEAYRQFANFRGSTEAELLAWLRKILAGQIALMLRRFFGTKGRDLKLEQELVGQLDDSSHAMNSMLAASGSSPSQHVSKQEQAVRLADLLDKLPRDYRETIYLRNVEGLPFAEVARRMNRSEDSVQKLWVRALSSLQRSLGESA